VSEFVELAFHHVGLDWRDHVEIDPNYYRASEVDYLLGDATKARRVLGWEPQTRFDDLVRIMVDSDVRLLEDELSGKLVLAGASSSRWMSGD
jgi:GDPmannose 4,6-dehydratase